MAIIVDFFLDYPLVLIPLIWVLIFTDLKLTRRGYKYYQDNFRDKVEYESYEINPKFQQVIHNRKPFPRKNLIGGFILGISAGLLAYIAIELEANFIAEILLGAILGLYIGLINQHFQNIRVFRFAGENPETITGKVSFSNEFTYASTKYLKTQFFIVWLVALLLTQSFVIFGAVIGELTMLFTISRWQRLMKLKKIHEEFNDKFAI